MKTNKQYILLLSFIGVLSGCSVDEALPPAPAAAFNVCVSESGYASASDGSSVSGTGEHSFTRTADRGYTTRFVAGDRIGVFAMKAYSREIWSEVNNLCLTAVSSPMGDGNLLWVDNLGNALLVASDCYYFAYYPWRETDSLPGAVDTSVNTTPVAPDLHFFANIVEGWMPSVMQATHADYTAQDLMIGEGKVSGNDIIFVMKHQMGLVIMEPPEVKYRLTTDADYTWTTNSPDGIEFSGFSPCYIDNVYRLLVQANTSPQILSATLPAIGGGRGTWTLSFPSLPRGKYIHWYPSFDGGDYLLDFDSEHPYELAVGDFYMKDGSLLPGNTTVPSSYLKANCIGIVYWLGDVKPDNHGLLDDKFHRGGTHGLVVALQNIREGLEGLDGGVYWHGNGGPIGLTIRDLLRMFHSEMTPGKGFENALADDFGKCGYANTLLCQEYNRIMDKKAGNMVEPVQYLDSFNSSYPAPSRSSGWYWPSWEELLPVCTGQGNASGTAGRDMLNRQFEKAGGRPLYTSPDHDYTAAGSYWSSTEYSNNSADAIDFSYSSDSSLKERVPKRYRNQVRFILAF